MGIIILVTQSLFETLYMIIGSSIIGIVLGTPLGIGLYNTSSQGLSPSPFLYNILSFFVNAVRSIPYIILMVLLIPVTRFLAGAAIGTMAAIIPLAIAAAFLFARVIEDAFNGVPKGLVEVGISMGASNRHIIQKILIPEALPQIISGSTIIIINLVGFSAMAGAVGGGGLGDIAIRYGYQRYDAVLMMIIVVILIVLVQMIQMLGNYLYKKTRH